MCAEGERGQPPARTAESVGLNNQWPKKMACGSRPVEGVEGTAHETHRVARFEKRGYTAARTRRRRVDGVRLLRRRVHC